MNDRIEIYDLVDIIISDMKGRPLSMIYIKDLVPAEMRDELIINPYGDEYVGWKFISSTITDADIDEVENKLGVTLPSQYRHFVQYKYFIELHTHNNAIRFENITDAQKLMNLVRTNHDYRNEILDDGFIIVASFYDFGYVLLRCNENNPKVYVAMFEDLSKKHEYADNLTKILTLDSNYANDFIEKYNAKQK